MKSQNIKDLLSLQETLMDGQKDVAKYYKVHPRTIRKWKSGESKPNKTHQRKINFADKERWLFLQKTDKQKQYFFHEGQDVLPQKYLQKTLSGEIVPSEKNRLKIHGIGKKKNLSTNTKPHFVNKEKKLDDANYQVVYVITKGELKKTQIVREDGKYKTIDKDLRGQSFYGSGYTWDDKKGKRESDKQARNAFKKFCTSYNVNMRNLKVERRIIERRNLL